MSQSITPPIDTSNPQAAQEIFSSTTETKKNSETPRKKLSLNDKKTTTRSRRLLNAHKSSPQFKVNPKNNKNSSQVDTDSQKTSGKSDKNKSFKNEIIYGTIFSLLIGFYDGFIGPGTGSFLVMFFISILGYDFLKASAHAKFVNLATNVGSIFFFAGNGNILFSYAIPMAMCNLTGSFLGARLAILKGNKFIRVFFLIVVAGTIIRFGYDIFIKK